MNQAHPDPSLHALAFNKWSSVSEHLSLVHSMEPCISVPGVQGPGRRDGRVGRFPERLPGAGCSFWCFEHSGGERD